MVKNKQKPKGFIAIISMLIITSISMIVAMGILQDGIENARLSLTSISYEKARASALTCLEDTMIRIKKEAQFNTNLNYTIDDENSCSSNISWGTGTVTGIGTFETPVLLQVVGMSSDFIRTFEYNLNIVRKDVNHSDGSLEYTNLIKIEDFEELN